MFGFPGCTFKRLARILLLLPIEFQAHLISHSKARNAPILIRKRSLLDAVNLMQPLRHNLCQLIMRNTCSLPTAKIDITFLFQMIHRIIYP